MRVTSSMYYKNVQAESSRANERLFDVNKQISSGLKIQYAGDDVSVFTETMRLDNELTSLGQIAKSAESGYKMSTQADTLLNEFQTTMDRTKTLLIQASNAAQSDVARDAIAAELRGVEEHFRNLSNTSINGQFIFSGSAVDVRPISSDGTYMGNDVALNSFVGAGAKQQYNLTGADLFLGEELSVKRTVTSNVPQYNLSAKYPDFSDPLSVDSGVDKIITVDDTIRDLMGDIDDVQNITAANHFYLSGTKSDGTAFNQKMSMSDNDTVDNLLTQIGNAYGNTGSLDLVNVTLNSYGEIVVEDKIKGSSKLDFHLVGAVDYNHTTDINGDSNNDDADITNLSDLDVGETDFDKIINGTSTAANIDLYVKEFVKSPIAPTLKSAEYDVSDTVPPAVPTALPDELEISVEDRNGNITTYNAPYDTSTAITYDNLKNSIEADGDFTVSVVGDIVTLNTTAQGEARGIFINTPLENLNVAVAIPETIVEGVGEYDKTFFTKDGSTLSSNTPQIIKATNAFASPSTKISEVADLSQRPPIMPGNIPTLIDTKFTLSGTDISGTAYTAQIDFASTGSTFSLDGGTTNYNIFNMENSRTAVNADDMTYQQLMDVTNMIVTGTLPDTDNTSPILIQEEDYDNAISSSNSLGNTSLSYDGKIQFEDTNGSNTKASIALYDSRSGDFATDASVMTFNSNNALTVRDPKTDFFKNLNEIITAVENHKLYPDSESGDMRSVGMENAIAMIDDLTEHVSRSHAMVGTQSNSLTNSLERVQLLEISTMTLRSSVIDTDIAKASLELTQMSLSYKAMLSTVAKVSQLSLVNYL